jgi:hypothetical protein
MFVSSAVSLLMIRQIFLSHAIIKEQHILVDAHETADGDAVYQSGWEKLAMSVYRSSAQDPAMLDLLKSEGISIHEGPPPGDASTPNAAPLPASGSKLPPAQHPAAP